MDRREEVIVKRRFIDLSQTTQKNLKFTRLDLNNREYMPVNLSVPGWSMQQPLRRSRQPPPPETINPLVESQVRREAQGGVGGRSTAAPNLP